MYTESSDLHAAGPLYQCSSLEGLDRYFRACVRMSADIRVSVSCVVVALFGFWLIKGYSVTDRSDSLRAAGFWLIKQRLQCHRPVRQPARGALA